MSVLSYRKSDNVVIMSGIEHRGHCMEGQDDTLLLIYS
jgi:hypothetical protein